ncbi:MAG: helix-turn-helix transcriptional regulator [Elusimicrobiota bacterium]|jgi:hypothetical protein
MNQFRQLRLTFKFTLQQWADVWQCSASHVHGWESGRSAPDADRWLEIAVVQDALKIMLWSTVKPEQEQGWLHLFHHSLVATGCAHGTRAMRGELHRILSTGYNYSSDGNFTIDRPGHKYFNDFSGGKSAAVKK